MLAAVARADRRACAPGWPASRGDRRRLPPRSRRACVAVAPARSAGARAATAIDSSSGSSAALPARPRLPVSDPAARACLADHGRRGVGAADSVRITGRLPYPMLAEELMQIARGASIPIDSSAGRDSSLPLRCAPRVLCRLAALHDDADYRARRGDPAGRRLRRAMPHGFSPRSSTPRVCAATPGRRQRGRRYWPSTLGSNLI